MRKVTFLVATLALAGWAGEGAVLAELRQGDSLRGEDEVQSLEFTLRLGAGGPSVGVMKVGTATATLSDVTIQIGAPGAGGATGVGGSGSSTPAQAGIAVPVWPA